MTEFDEVATLKELKEETKNIRYRCYKKYRSRLDRYKNELLILYQDGATRAELKRWLRRKKIKVAWSTVNRWIAKNG